MSLTSLQTKGAVIQHGPYWIPRLSVHESRPIISPSSPWLQTQKLPGHSTTLQGRIWSRLGRARTRPNPHRHWRSFRNGTHQMIVRRGKHYTSRSERRRWPDRGSTGRALSTIPISEKQKSASAKGSSIRGTDLEYLLFTSHCCG